MPVCRALTFVVLATALAAAGSARAQNLVVNPGFELYSVCPPALGQLDGHCDDWVRTGLGSTDYHHTCGFWTHAPRTGEAHVGLIPFDSSDNYREYATGRLVSPLEAGSTYRVEFWVILSEGRLHAIQELSAWFTDTEPTFSGAGPPPGVTPQFVNGSGTLEDKVNWMQVTGTFVAAGGEQWITLGNFFTDADTTSVFFGCCGQHGAYYHLDDVSVVKAGSQPAVAVTCAPVGDRCDEDARWDADGRLDFGEVYEVDVSIQNVGADGITGYTATVVVPGATVEIPPGGAIALASLPVGATEVVAVSIRMPLRGGPLACDDPVDLTLAEQTADGGATFPDADLAGCDAVLDGCQTCGPVCLHRADVASLLPHAPPRTAVYVPRDGDDVALAGAPRACPFADGDLEPDPLARVDGVPLALFQVSRPGDTLRLEAAGDTIRFRF